MHKNLTIHLTMENITMLFILIGCPPVFDSVLCWPATAPNTTLSIPCSMALHKLTDDESQTFSYEGKITYIQPFQHLNKKLFLYFVASAFRDCLENGTWAKMANYDECLDVSYNL